MRGTDGFPVRVRFTKLGKVRFISHRDVARAFERAFRTESLPLAFTLGFSPRPKVSFGLALSVGHESVAEYLDVELTRPVDTGELPGRLTAALPEGIDVTGTAPLADRAPALQDAVTLVEYRVSVTDSEGGPVDAAVMARLVDAALARETLPVTRVRKGRESVDDIRPALRGIEVTAGRAGAGQDVDTDLAIAVSTQGRGARPCEVLDALSGDGIVLTERRVVRIEQWIERDGARVQPLEADALARTEAVRA